MLQLGRIDAAQANPCRQLEPGRQMHPRLESIAIDRSDDIDWVPDIRISRALPDHFAVPRRCVEAGAANAPNAQRQHCPCHDRNNEQPGQGRRKPAAPVGSVSIYSPVWVHIPK